MTTILHHPHADAARSSSLWARVAHVIATRGLGTIVLADAADPELVAQVAALGLPTWVIDPRPAALADARRRLVGCERVQFVQGTTARTLADLRGQLPERTLFVFGDDERPGCSARDGIFFVPRGAGAVLVMPGAPSGRVRHGAVQDQLIRWSADHHVESLVTPSSGTALLALPRAAVHVTFLIEKYTHEYGKSGLSINLDNLVATLDQTGHATWNVVHYDECFHEGVTLTPELLAAPAGTDVHVVACTLHYHSRANPSVALLQHVKARGSKVVFFWLDKKISANTPEYYEVADLNVVLDGNDFDLPRSWPIFTPKNPRFFHDAGLERDIDVSLVGEVRYLSQRKAMVDRLRTESRVVVSMFGTSAADTGRALSVADYALLYKRSKISLAMTKDSVRQLKGRVFEIVHCGAMLLCDRNHHVSHYLRPGVDYVAYGDYDDLVAKARWYLDHDHERRTIAASGHRRVVAHCSHEVFWRSLLARLGACAEGIHGKREEG